MATAVAVGWRESGDHRLRHREVTGISIPLLFSDLLNAASVNKAAFHFTCDWGKEAGTRWSHSSIDPGLKGVKNLGTLKKRICAINWRKVLDTCLWRQAIMCLKLDGSSLVVGLTLRGNASVVKGLPWPLLSWHEQLKNFRTGGCSSPCFEYGDSLFQLLLDHVLFALQQGVGSS